MSAQIIDDAFALLAVDHICVETARMDSFKVSNPGNSFSSERIKICIVPDHKGNFRPTLRKHDSAPASYIKKRQREEFTPPHPLHNPLTDGGQTVFAAKAEAFLNLRMKKLELLA
jgi:hypothetical protein